MMRRAGPHEHSGPALHHPRRHAQTGAARPGPPELPGDVTVTNTADNGAGSLRKALGTVCGDGIISFAGPCRPDHHPALWSVDARQERHHRWLRRSRSERSAVTIRPASSKSTPARRPLSRYLTAQERVWLPVGGGILNNGSLTLDHVDGHPEYHGNQRRRILAGRRRHLQRRRRARSI